MPRPYAFSAFAASAPVTGLVRSTLSLPPAQAHSARPTAAIQRSVIIAFPCEPQRACHLRGAVSLRDERPEGAAPLLVAGRRPAAQHLPQRALEELRLGRALRRLAHRGARLRRAHSLLTEPALGEPRPGPPAEQGARPRAGHLQVVHVSQLPEPRHRFRALPPGYPSLFQREVHLQGRVGPPRQQPQRPIQRGHANKHFTRSARRKAERAETSIEKNESSARSPYLS